MIKQTSLADIIDTWLPDNDPHFRVTMTSDGYGVMCQCPITELFNMIRIQSTSVVSMGFEFDNKIEISATDPKFFDALKTLLRMHCRQV